MGNVRYSWDGKGNLSQVEYSSTYDHAYPTKTISPIPDTNGTYGLDVELETTTTYDLNTGLPLSVTDPNGAVTSMEYEDPLLRPTKVTTGYGTALAAETVTEYGAGTSASTRWVRVRTQIDETRWKEAVSWFDALGRGIRSQNIDPESGDVFSLTCYDNMGRVAKATNPFRGYTTQDCTTTSGLEWTTNTYDAAGRPWKVTTPDGAFVETLYSLSTSGEIGTVVTVKDQALKERRSITNAIGQLKRVDEPSGTLGLGAITAPYQPTSYAYDLLNNLTTVTQIGDTTAECGGASSCTQSRTFTYDALSRLKSAVNPESGTINYTYDANNNLATKTDARGITTNYTYDRLNRVTERSYAMPSPTPSPSQYQNSPTVNYYYDNITNGKGKLKKVTSSVSTTEYTSFDILGRVTASKQTTDGVEYGGSGSPATMTYTYNLGGAMVEQQYPSGRVVKNTLDATGDLSIVQSKKNADSGYWHYADSPTYNAAGALTSLQLGNGRWESTVFNSRLQPTQIALGTVQNSCDNLKLNFDYGSTANNGNVQSQTITVPTVGSNPGFTAVQTYTYDSLNRLKAADEKPYGWTTCTSDPTKCWTQTFTFDRYGNRRFDEANTSMPASFSNQALTNPTISTSNNRLTSTGWTYDASGNTTGDPQSRTFIYDGENKQVDVKNSSSVTIGQYSYDGDGRRVKKYVPGTGETTIFVYDAAGKQIAEYSTIVADSSSAKVSYLTNDHLGSPRINTDVAGAVTARHDYHPFGEEVTVGRTSHSEYTPDSVRKQFTGYERDGETDLDFAQARLLQNGHGRFVQADPYNIIFEKEKGRSQKEKAKIFMRFVAQPQNWNRYVYVVNSPLNYVDPLGLTYLRDSKGTYYYISDEIYKQNGFKEWVESKIGKFSLVPDGSRVSLGQNATGMFEKFRGQTVILGARGLIIPVNSPDSMSGREHESSENPSVSAREATWVRPPDFYQAEQDIPLVGFGGLALQETVDRNGQAYFGVGGYLGFPSVDFSGGYLPQRYRAYPFENENFLTGASMGGFIVGLGGTYSSYGQFAPQVGTGALPGVSATYCIRTPAFDFPYQP